MVWKNHRVNIIIRKSVLRYILTPQLNNMSTWHRVLCGCYCCISTIFMYSLFFTWIYQYLKQLNNTVAIIKTEGLVKWKFVVFKFISFLWCRMLVIYKINRHVNGNNVYLSIWNTFSASLETCVVMFFQIYQSSYTCLRYNILYDIIVVLIGIKVTGKKII